MPFFALSPVSLCLFVFIRKSLNPLKTHDFFNPVYSLYIVTVLQGEDSEGVAQIMYSCVRISDFLRDLFEVQIDPLRLQMVTDIVGEDQGFAVL